MEQVLSGEEKRVCVTGASGYIASWIVKLLLERGYTVNATVRSLNDPTKTKHLLALDGAENRLHLFEANLLEEGSFDSAIHGCHGVFHTASPVIVFSTNPEVEVIDPAVKGTLNVLASCAKAPSVKRVIFTSSTAAVKYTDKPLADDTVIDETWFSSLEMCKGKKGECYLISKTLAEDAAWKFSKENGIDMVSINPAAVRLGSCKRCCGSTYPCLGDPFSNGRYILSETVAQISKIVKILHDLYPSLKLPNKCEDDEPPEPTYMFSKDKTKTLGIEFIPLKTALKETVECLEEKFKISV
ncbi:Tetraketide alpha-pyrone reductase 1 [Bienertia sinuspersici]